MCDEEVATAESRAEMWERVGRDAVASELDAARKNADDAIYDITHQTLERGEDPTQKQILQTRMKLNRLRDLLENRVAPIAGEEPYGQPIPQMPVGTIQEYLEGEHSDGGSDE